METIIELPIKNNYKNVSMLELCALNIFGLDVRMLRRKGYDISKVGQWKANHSPDEDGCYEIMKVLVAHKPHGITFIRIGMLYKDGETFKAVGK